MRNKVINLTLTEAQTKPPSETSLRTVELETTKENPVLFQINKSIEHIHRDQHQIQSGCRVGLAIRTIELRDSGVSTPHFPEGQTAPWYKTIHKIKKERKIK